jgi:hypothetical protein
MPQATPIADPAMPLWRQIAQPAILILLMAHAVPILGVLLWNWDAFLLLVLYWMETAVIGFWTLWLIGKAPDRTIGPYNEGKSTAHLIAFFTLHAGIFMTVHFVFLWSLFAGDWKSQIHNLSQFISVIVIGQGLWMALVFLFVARGIAPMLLIYGPPWYSRQWLPDAASVPNPWHRDGILYALYARIIVMQIAIIASGFIIEYLGGASAAAPLIVLIIVKTAIDLGLFLRTGFDVGKTAEVPAQ